MVVKSWPYPLYSGFVLLCRTTNHHQLGCLKHCPFSSASMAQKSQHRVAQPDSLLRRSRGWNEGVGRAAFLSGKLGKTIHSKLLAGRTYFLLPFSQGLLHLHAGQGTSSSSGAWIHSDFSFSFIFCHSQRKFSALTGSCD